MPCEIIVGKKYRVKKEHEKYFSKSFGGIIKIFNIRDNYVITSDNTLSFHVSSSVAKGLIPYKQRIG